MRQSNDKYQDGKLLHGFDYQLQVWVKDGICDDIGLNSHRFKGKMWLDARLEMLGEKAHQMCLVEELTSRGLEEQLLGLPWYGRPASPGSEGLGK